MSDSPNTTDILNTVLTVSHGTITVGTPGGIVSDNGSASVTLTGTAAAINAALATTSYTGNLNYFGSDSLAVTTTDTNNGASSGTQTAAITINNSTTVIETVPEALSGNENSAISLATITVSDSPNTTDILSTTLTVSHGTITVGTPGGIVSDNGSASVTLTGTAAAINAALATTSYTGNLNYFGSDSLAVTTTDTNNGASSGTQTAAITINNSTTVIETVPEALSGNENSAISLATITVSDSPNTTDILT